jgi:hypothetical protein
MAVILYLYDLAGPLRANVDTPLVHQLFSNLLLKVSRGVRLIFVVPYNRKLKADTAL